MDISLDIKRLGDNSIIGKFMTFCIKNNIDHEESHNITFDIKSVIIDTDISQQEILFKLMFPNSSLKINIDHQGWDRIRAKLYDTATGQDLFSSTKQEDIDWVINHLSNKYYPPQEKK